MKTVLYYFTGTGNSLAVARAIAVRLSETEIVPIPMLMLHGEKIAVPTNANIGTVYPLYALGLGLPNIVVIFFKILDLSATGYVFSVVTEGGKFGPPTKQIAKLAKRSAHDLNAAWWIQMPDSYIPLFAPPEKNSNRKPFGRTRSVNVKLPCLLKRSVHAARARLISPFRVKFSDS